MVRVQACLRQKASDPGLSFVGLETSRGTDSHNPTRCPNLQGQQRLVDLCSIHPCLATKTTVIWAESFCAPEYLASIAATSPSPTFRPLSKKVTLWKNKQPILIAPVGLTWRSVSKVSAPLSLPAKSMKLILPCSWTVVSRSYTKGGSGSLFLVAIFEPEALKYLQAIVYSRRVLLHKILLDCSPTSFFWGGKYEDIWNISPSHHNRNVKTCSLLPRLLGGQIFQTDLKNCMRSRPGFHIPSSLEVSFTLEPPVSVGLTKFDELTPQWSSAYISWAQKAVKNGEVCIFGACIQFKSVLMVLKTV